MAGVTPRNLSIQIVGDSVGCCPSGIARRRVLKMCYDMVCDYAIARFLFNKQVFTQHDKSHSFCVPVTECFVYMYLVTV
jgi:hypothetical protein